MKNNQKEKAKDMYFHTDMSKTEIAEKLGVNRKTVLFWSQEGNWEKIRKSARHLPAIVAEKCYYIIDNYASYMLTDGNAFANYNIKDALFLNQMATVIKKIKNRDTVCESMETFKFFISDLDKRNPEMARLIAPAIEEYIEFRAGVTKQDVLLEGFSPDGTLPIPGDAQINEQHQDAQQHQELMADFELFLATRAKSTAPPTTDTPAQASPGVPHNDEKTALNKAA